MDFPARGGGALSNFNQKLPENKENSPKPGNRAFSVITPSWQIW